MGELLRAGDPGYDETRRGYNLLHDLRPAVIVRPVDGRDVARALELATGAGLEVAVRSGGHSLAGYGGTEAGCCSTCPPCGPSRSTRPRASPWSRRDPPPAT
jgi:hypothetical protein